LLRRVHVDQAPADGASQHLPERLRRFEAMPSRDRHAPGCDLRRANATDTAVAERGDGLREQPAELRDRLWLAVVLGEVDLDELA
jgi:hypothetical protein